MASSDSRSALPRFAAHHDLSGSSLPARFPSGSRVFTPGAETGLSCSHDGCPTIPRPLRRRVLRGCTPSSSPRPWPSPQQPRLGSRLVPCGWLFTTRQASLHAADRWVAPSKRGLDPALRPRDLSRRRRAATKAAWPLLWPDSHRLVIVSLTGRTPLKNPSEARSWPSVDRPEG